jgi:hypothetical protein
MRSLLLPRFGELFSTISFEAVDGDLNEDDVDAENDDESARVGDFDLSLLLISSSFCSSGISLKAMLP